MSNAMSCGQPKCFRSASLMCSRCSSVFYCSKECQVAAFSSHRLGCFELPTLIDVKAMRSPSTMEFVEESESNVSGTKDTNASSVTGRAEQKTEEPQQKSEPREKVAESPAQKTRTESSSPVPQRSLAKPAVKKLPVAPVEPSRIFFRDMTMRAFPRGEFQAVVVAVVEEKNLFTIFEASDENSQMLESITKAIEDIADKEKSVGYKPQLKEVVLAVFEGLFYRAVCEKVQDSSFEVRFIDYGNVSTVAANEIMKFDSKKVPKDVFVHQCLFSNMPDVLNEQAVAALSGDTIAVKGAYKEEGDEVYVATLVGI